MHDAASDPHGGESAADNAAASKALALQYSSPTAGSETNSRRANFDLPPADQPLSYCALAFLFFIVVFGIATAYVAPHPFRACVAYFAALLPAGACFALIVYRLRDQVVTKSFLLYLVFLTAVPVMFLVTVVELVIAIVGLLTVLGSSFEALAKEYAEGMAAIAKKVPQGTTLTPEQKKAVKKSMEALWKHIKSKVPMWQIVALVLIMAFAVAGFTEEMAKYLVGKRYRTKLNDGIRCQGVIACASAAGLGLAGAEHVMYAGSYMAQMSFFSALLEGAIRACVAFPLHVGTTFWAGTRMARYAILKEPVNVAYTLLVPILFHGSLDAFAFFAAVESTSAPILSYLTMPFNIILIGLLMFLCRRNYFAVLEKEAQILDAEDADRGLEIPTASV